MRLTRPEPLRLLLVTLALTAGALWFEGTLANLKSAVAGARLSYATAVESTRLHLAGSLHTLSSDAAMLQNLNWGYTNSVGSALRGALRPGEIDALQIVDQSCHVLAHEALEHSPDVACPDGAAKFFWMHSAATPILGLQLPVGGKSKLYLVGLVHFGPQWEATYPTFASMKKALNLAVSPGEELKTHPLLWREGRMGQQDFAVLTSHDQAIELLAPFLQSQEPLAFPPSWLCLGLAFFLAAAALLKHSADQETLARQMQDAAAWFKQLAAGKANAPKPPTDGGASLSTPIFAAALSQCQTFAWDLAKADEKSLQEKTKEEERLRLALASVQRDLQKTQQHLSELVELDSLALQLKRLTKAFLDKLGELHAATTTLNSDLARMATTDCHTLRMQITAWQSGITTRGARKFLRSLAETAGSAPETTLLDDELAFLDRLSASLARTHAEGATLTGHILGGINYVSRIAALWHGMSLRSDGDETCPSLSLALEDAQRLVALASSSGLSFVTLIEAKDDTAIPHLPRSLWAAALYHLHMALLEPLLTQGLSGIKIVARLKPRQDQMVLVLSVAGASAKSPVDVKSDKQRQQFNLSMASQLLAPFGVQAGLLPVIDGPSPLVLSWSATAHLQKVLESQEKHEFAGGFNEVETTM